MQDTAATLRKIIGQIETELKGKVQTDLHREDVADGLAAIETSTMKCKAEAEQVFDCPGLQDFKVRIPPMNFASSLYVI